MRGDGFGGKGAEGAWSGGECLRFAGEKVWQEDRGVETEVEQRVRDRGTLRAAVRRQKDRKAEETETRQR